MERILGAFVAIFFITWLISSSATAEGPTTSSKPTDLVYDTVVDHELPGVTPDMIDWWGVNMEKGYALWHPEDHKSFRWEVAPAKVGGRVGAIQVVEESMGRGPVQTITIRYVDPIDVVNLPFFYRHMGVSGNPDPDGKIRNFLVHQFEATDYGTRMRTLLHVEAGIPLAASEAFAKHNKEEMGRLPYFLPELYKLWQVVKDPKLNVKACLVVKKLPDGRYTYEVPGGAGKP